MDETIQCPSGAGCVVWKMLEEAGTDFSINGHIHYYARDAPEYAFANNGTGAVDMASVGNNTGNSTNPVQTYLNPKYMVTVVCAAPGDQEVNSPRPPFTAAAGAPQHSLTSSNNYGYSLLRIVNETTLVHTFTTAVPHVNSTAPHYSDELTLIVEKHGPRASAASV